MVASETPDRRKNIRLCSENYFGQRTYFITICCEKRHRFFADSARCARLIEHLRAISTNQYFLVHAYCVMPDHFHVLVEGQNAGSNLLEFVRLLKQRTSFEEKKNSGTQLWQRYFYDHILRPKNSADVIAWYIWLNPVRKGLCAEPEDYPFSGSFTLEWKRRVRPAESWAPPWKKRL